MRPILREKQKWYMKGSNIGWENTCAIIIVLMCGWDILGMFCKANIKSFKGQVMYKLVDIFLSLRGQLWFMGPKQTPLNDHWEGIHVLYAWSSLFSNMSMQKQWTTKAIKWHWCRSLWWIERVLTYDHLPIEWTSWSPKYSTLTIKIAPFNTSRWWLGSVKAC